MFVNCGELDEDQNTFHCPFMQKSMHSIGFVYIFLLFTAVVLLRDDRGQLSEK